MVGSKRKRKQNRKKKAYKRQRKGSLNMAKKRKYAKQEKNAYARQGNESVHKAEKRKPTQGKERIRKWKKETVCKTK